MGAGTGRPSAARWDEVSVCVGWSSIAAEVAERLASAPGLRVRLAEDGAPPDPAASVLVGHHFPPGSLAGLPRLRWVHLTGTGADHLAATGLADGVLVTCSAEVPVVAVAEYAVSGLLHVIKDLPRLAAPRSAEWFYSEATLLAGSAVGVVGAGRIGRAVIARLAAWGALPVAVTRDGLAPVVGAHRTIGTQALEREARHLDHLVVCLPGGPATRRLVGRAVLTALPAHAVVVNVGRGETVANDVLYEELRAGRLRGAFVDVHEQEPLPEDAEEWDVPGLTVSPHRGFAFPAEAAEVARTFLDRLAALRRGASVGEVRR
ncbi:NAD(P)-dependent oxidoreductase [Nocardioides campestrisoli]|uniref:NAD(P)-dependent oxidoreductase n=1 Tax=Nocardioides campestrisoli TaxID=2736757 RepID=UPI00163D5595|nr:NAD(P)-dependent oxidoreductase [Nocardioides campestrisoli]